MTEQFEAIIFDFDYTLADPSRGLVDCINFALRGLELPAATPDAILNSNGLSLADVFERFAGPAADARFDEFVDLFVQRADEVMVDATDLFPAAPAAIRRLQRKEVPLGIVSMKYRYHIEPVLLREGLFDAFAVVIGGDDVSVNKPDPEGILMAMDRLGSRPATSLFVGDSLIDAETAARAGVPFVALLSGPATRDAFLDYDVHRIVKSLADLPGVVGLH